MPDASGEVSVHAPSVPMFVLTQSIELSSYLSANFRGLVLGCIEADFLQINARWKALDEICQIYFSLHLSYLNKSANVRCEFC